MPLLRKAFLRLVRLVALVYVGLVALLVGCQNRMIYFPTKGEPAALLKQAESESLEPWKDAAGSVIGWKRPAPRTPRRMLVFHGNAGYALHRAYYADGLERLGWEVHLLEYPGYGARTGSPGKDAFHHAARAAAEELLRADARPLYLLGESIGSGVACGLAAEMPDKIRGILLVTPFARLVEVAQWHYPYLPIGWILRDKFDNIAGLEKFRGPVVVAIAENDEFVPADQGRKLHAAYTGPKHLITFTGATHNAFPTAGSEPWWKEASDFLGR